MIAGCAAIRADRRSYRGAYQRPGRDRPLHPVRYRDPAVGDAALRPGLAAGGQPRCHAALCRAVPRSAVPAARRHRGGSRCSHHRTPLRPRRRADDRRRYFCRLLAADAGARCRYAGRGALALQAGGGAAPRRRLRRCRARSRSHDRHGSSRAHRPIPVPAPGRGHHEFRRADPAANRFDWLLRCGCHGAAEGERNPDPR